MAATIQASQAGSLSIYSVLGGDASPTSKLVVEGDTEGSPTNIRVINQNGSGGYTDKGILVVVVRGKSDPNAFTLAYDYKQPTARLLSPPANTSITCNIIRKTATGI